MRPQSIVNFERVLLLMIVLGLVSAVLNWDAMMAQFAAQGLSQGVVIAAYAIELVISLLLLWLIARRRSNIARWVYVLLCLAGVAYTFRAIPAALQLPLPALLMQAAQWLLLILSIWLLFTRDSRAWFAGSGEAPAV